MSAVTNIQIFIHCPFLRCAIKHHPSIRSVGKWALNKLLISSPGCALHRTLAARCMLALAMNTWVIRCSRLTSTTSCPNIRHTSTNWCWFKLGTLHSIGKQWVSLNDLCYDLYLTSNDRYANAKNCSNEGRVKLEELTDLTYYSKLLGLLFFFHNNSWENP